MDRERGCAPRAGLSFPSVHEGNTTTERARRTRADASFAEAPGPLSLFSTILGGPGSSGGKRPPGSKGSSAVLGLGRLRLLGAGAPLQEVLASSRLPAVGRLRPTPPLWAVLACTSIRKRAVSSASLAKAVATSCPHRPRAPSLRSPLPSGVPSLSSPLVLKDQRFSQLQRDVGARLIQYIIRINPRWTPQVCRIIPL